jgi:hypothetical protein
MRHVRKTVRYECVGGPRDGDVVLIPRGRREVTLDGHRYLVRPWERLDGAQRTLFKRERLVWEGLD